MGTSLYSYESNIPAPAADLFAYHERPATIQRLTPPWDPIRILSKSGGIENGDSVALQIKIGPFNCTWKAKHQDYSKNKEFTDVQVKGPFKYWKHMHSFRSIDHNVTNLKDTIQFELPFGKLGYRIGYFRVRARLNRIFTYRHNTTENDMKHWMALRSFEKCKVAITGGNGLIGSELAVFLQTQGHEVVILSRSGQSKVFGVQGVRWDPERKFIDSKYLIDVDCWIHLAGENLTKRRWTDRQIKKIRDSRVEGTKFLVDYLLKLENPPKSFICASAVGYYGSNKEERSESSKKGQGILAEICEAWEEASKRLDDSPIRRVILRTGLVLSYKGGALPKLLPLFKFGLGGPVGKGDQYWSWVAMDDLLRIIDMSIQDPAIKGIVNAVAPLPVTNREFTKELSSALRRPAILPAPEWALRTLLGRMVDETLLSNSKVVPARLQELDFNFHFPELELALTHCLGTY